MIEGFPYKFKEDGSIDWRSMIPPQFLYIQKQYKEALEKKLDKKFSDISVTEVEDKHLCITLAGIRYIANIRGYRSEERNVQFASYNNEYNLVGAVTVCSKIEWIPNIETDGRSIISSDIGGASINSVDDFSKPFIDAIASNRAFVRNVRGFLNIGIVGNDELSTKPASIAQANEGSDEGKVVDPYAILERKLFSYNLNFDKLKAFIKKNMDSALSDEVSPFTEIRQIKSDHIYAILGAISKAEEEKKKAKIK